MSTAAVRRPSVHLWLPLLVLIAAPLAGAAIWYWPSEWERAGRTVMLFAVALIALIVLAFWALVLARGVRWLSVATGAVVLLGGLFLAVGVREVHFNGDMIPTVTFRW